MKPAVEVFGEWALKGKDEGMERGHASSVAEMLAYAMAKSFHQKRNSLLSILAVGMVGLSARFRKLKL